MAPACNLGGETATLDAQSTGRDAGADAAPSCQGLQLCTVDGQSCDGDTLVVCATNPQGCIVEANRVDCTATGRTCVGSPGVAFCDYACEDECEEEAATCNGNVLEACAHTGGCLQYIVTDCTETDQVCDPSEDPPVCADPGSVENEGEDCASAIVLTGSTTVEHSSEAYANDYQDYGGDCLGVAGAGPDVVYEVSVPPDTVVAATMTFAAGWTEALTIVSACDDLTTCLAGTIGEERIAWANSSDSAQTVYLIADGQYAVSIGDYTLEVELTDAGCGNGILEPLTEECDDGGVVSGDGCSATCEIEGEHCTSPILLAGPGTYSAYTGDFANSYSGGCGSNGQDVIFAIDVPADATLTATMQPAGFDAVLALGDACDAIDDNACLEKQDSGGLGASETITRENSSAATKTFYLIADHYYLFGGGAFDLTVDLSS
jgi:cysteine-rich repeat protein